MATPPFTNFPIPTVALDQTLITAFGFRTPAPTDPTTVFISPTGNDNNSGTAGSPFQTLTRASFFLNSTYDFLAKQAKIKCAAGTYNFATTGDSGFYAGENVVGGNALGAIIVEGADPNDPTTTVFNAAGTSAAGASLPPGSTTNVLLNGISINNTQVAVNNQSEAGTIFLGNTRFNNCSNITFDNESGGAIISGGIIMGSTPRIRIAGTHSQLIYCGGSWFDFDSAILDFEAGCTFSFAVFNVSNGGVINYHDNANQGIGTNPTGQRFFISGGGVLNADNITQTTKLNPTAMPGTVAGLNQGGYFNNISETSWKYTVATLPTPITGGAIRAMVTDSNSTTFNNTVAGGGANTVPVWYNGTNWKIG